MSFCTHRIRFARRSTIVRWSAGITTASGQLARERRPRRRPVPRAPSICDRHPAVAATPRARDQGGRAHRPTTRARQKPVRSAVGGRYHRRLGRLERPRRRRRSQGLLTQAERRQRHPVRPAPLGRRVAVRCRSRLLRQRSCRPWGAAVPWQTREVLDPAASPLNSR